MTGAPGTEVNQAWADVLKKFKDNSIFGDKQIDLDVEGEKEFRGIFDTTVKPAVEKYGVAEWLATGRAYILDQAGDIAKLSCHLAAMHHGHSVDKKSVRTAANWIIAYQQTVCHKLMGRAASRGKDVETKGHFCEGWKVASQDG